MNDELYHYGVPGMKWGQRKAKLMEKAGYYRKAASDNASDVIKQYKYSKKADKLEKKAASLDTTSGKVAYHAKRGALATAGALAAIGAAPYVLTGLAAATMQSIEKIGR